MHDPRERDDTEGRLTRAADPTDACLDAETLAAWMDGGLSAEALDLARLHVADCSRCQALVGAFTRLDRSLPPMQPAPRAARGWLAWLVPIAAAAAAVTLWIVVPGRSPAPVPPGAPAASDQVARFQPATPPAVNPPPASPTSPAPRANVVAQAGHVAGAAKVAGAPAPEPAPAAAKESSRKDTATATPANAPESRALSDTAGPARTETPPAAAMAAPLALQRAAAAPAPSGIVIAAPDSSVRWRITPSGVERSIDAGTTWTAAPTGVAAELTAGAAPSATVCWLVGKAGVVLLTTDGRTWRRVRFPEPTDLSAVRTADASGLASSVTTRDGRTFRTSDQGATWIAVQDF